MENMNDISREELAKLIEKAEKELREQLEKMTPEERAQAEIRAQKLIEEDRAENQRLIDEAARLLSGSAPEAKEKPKFCTNCGAPAGSGNFCEYCGSPLIK